MGAFLKRNIFPVIAAGFFLVAAIIFLVVDGGNAAQLAEQEQQIEQAQAQRSELSTQIAEEDRTAHDALLGVDSQRLEDDETAIRDLLETTLTWSDHDSYVNARNEVMRTYDIDEDSAYMTSFMPEAPINRDAQGNEYYYLDALELNSRLGAFNPKVLSVTGTEYRYMVLVDAQSNSVDGNATATSSSIVLLTTDGTGAVTDVTGYASTSPVRTSS